MNFTRTAFGINSKLILKTALFTTLLANTCKNSKCNEKILPIQSWSDTPTEFRPDLKLFERLDTQLLNNSAFVVDHAVHETLNGESKIEVYEIYRKLNSDEIYCIVKFGKSINGYPGIVHGGS